MVPSAGSAWSMAGSFSALTVSIRAPRALVARLLRVAGLLNDHREDTMIFRNAIGATALAASLLMIIAGASAQDATKYPDWSGKWIGKVGGYDPSKPPGRGQEAPLTAEYQAIFEAGLADYAAGGQGNNPTYLCIPPGMPRITEFSSESILQPPESLDGDYRASGSHAPATSRFMNVSPSDWLIQPMGATRERSQGIRWRR